MRSVLGRSVERVAAISPFFTFSQCVVLEAVCVPRREGVCREQTASQVPNGLTQTKLRCAVTREGLIAGTADFEKEYESSPPLMIR